MKKLKNWIPAIIMCALIFGLSAVPGEVVDSTGIDQEIYFINAHFSLYFVLFFTFFKGTKNIQASIFLSFLYAITDEYHQTFVPGRSAQILDIIVDTLGATLGGLILWKYEHLIPTKLKNWLNN